MSQTYSIGCCKCKVHLWIAQSSQESKTLYSGVPDTMDALKRFLFDHQGHPLVFDNDCTDAFADSEEIILS